MTFYSYTQNEAKQYGQSGNALVDFLASAAAQRASVMNGNDNLIELFVNAYNMDKEASLKLIHWLRDPRGGAGEKAAYNKIVDYLYKMIPQAVMNNLDAVVKYGSYNTLISLAKKTKGTKDYKKIMEKFATDIKSKDRLANKWAPRLHAKDHDMAIYLRTILGMTNSEYRKWTKTYSQTIEQLMAQGKWSDIEYSKVPSIAMKKYRKAFIEHDKDRFEAWKNDLNSKANSSVLYPHDVLKMIGLNGRNIYQLDDDGDIALAEKLWKNLPNYLTEDARIMTMIDVSGSMTWNEISKGITPLTVAISLGLYLSERMVGEFHNSFITFSSKPTLFKLKNNAGLVERVNEVLRSDIGYNTDFYAAYKLLLEYAKRNNVPQEHMPTMILALSDMQFDQAGGDTTHLDSMRKMYKDYGYEMPKLVFWNLDEKFTGTPARYNHKNTALVSGFSPSILKAILKDEDFDPVKVVYETIDYINDLDFSGIPDQINYDRAIATCSSIR